MTRSIWASPDEQAAERLGVLSRSQAEQRPEWRRRVRAGAWTAYGSVVVTHNGSLSSEQADWVALLRCGAGAVLGAVSAMRWWGARLEPPPRPQVVLPARRAAPRLPGVDVRRSRLLGPAHVHPLRQPPRLRLARATLDAASLARTPDDVRRLVCAPVQQRLVRVPELRQALLRLGPHPGRALLLRTLDALEHGAQTMHELQFLRLLRGAGLPEPDCQTLRTTIDGRRYLDDVWDEYALHVEIDGLAHMWVDQWLDDLRRNNELEIARPERRLRFAGHQLGEEPDLVVAQVRRALLAGGWSGR